MKNLYSTGKSTLRILSVLVMLITAATTTQAQVRKAFTQRTSQYSPTKKIYNIKGDFTMLGNTNLTPQNYSATTNNNGQYMVYVDTDNDPTTLNSSMATLQLSTENGAVPACSNIIYAGLYWTGKSSPNMTFTASSQQATGTQAVNSTFSVGHDENIQYTNYALSVTRNNPSSNNRNPIYTFTGNGNTYVFYFYNSGANPRVTVSVNGGSAVAVPATINGANTEATFTTPYSITDGGVTLKINKLIRSSATNLSTSDTQNTSSAQVTVTGNAPVYTTVTKNYDKKNIRLKGPGDASYTQFTANLADIYYPSGTDDDIYSAYVEVTDFVKNHGIGSYWVGDVPLLEGNVGGTGYSGGWGMVVVYENNLMKYRDVTIFDGYAYVEASNNSSQTLPVSGFNTVQTGNVGLKLGVMASEGDVAFTGDYFQVQKLNSATYQSLSHSGNSTTNFFNSSIISGGARNPMLVNNTGIDVSEFTVSNPNNSVIGNSQTATNFKYGTSGDTYSIFVIAMAVDAYIPDVESVLSAVTINGQPATMPLQNVQPGQEMLFKVQIKNKGTEAINNYKITIPIPYNATYVANSAQKSVFFTPLPVPNNLSYQPTVGSNGSIVWDFGTLPLPASPDTVLAELTFRLTATTDCSILKNFTCSNSLSIDGSQSGVGAITGINFSQKNLVQGFTGSGTCQGNPVAAPLLLNINATDYVNQYCQDTPPISAFTFCSPGANIPITSISGSFPPGSLFYNEFPVTGNSVQYTINNPFPATAGAHTYYAVPPNSSAGCYIAFSITVTTISSQPTAADVDYCLGATAVALSATPSTPGMMLFYYDSVNGTAQASITPSTASVGTFTYYVAEGQSAQCIGPKKAITVHVYPQPSITAPANATVQGCSTSAITGLVFSATPVNISAAQFTAAGGSFPNAGSIGSYALTYQDVANGSCPTVVTRTFTLTSACGNQTVTQTLTIQDTTAPVISPLPGAATIQCSDAPQWTTPTASDNCGGQVTLTSNTVTTPGSCANAFTLTRTWTATDTCGNASTASQVINVIDTTIPVISGLPGVSTIQCSDTPNWVTPTAIDNCLGAVSLTSTTTTTPGNCSGQYKLTRIWVATDACGNMASASQVINVEDTTAPVIAPLPAVSMVDCPAVPVFAQATATDNCDPNVTLTYADHTTPGACTGSYSITRTWTATDSCGNQSTASQTINVKDDTPPAIISQASDLTVECDGSGNQAALTQWLNSHGGATASDTCSDANLTWTNDYVSLSGGCNAAVTVTFTVTDLCGNSATTTATFTVHDTTAPVAPPAPATITVACAGEVPAMISLTATDNCAGNITVQGTDVTTPGACANTFTVNRTWTFTDACNNTSSVSQTINVHDTVAPVISQLPAVSTISCPATPSFAQASATDNCAGQVSLTFNDVTTPGSCANNYSVTRTWTATDMCGNTATATQTINVQDVTAPVISTQASNITVQCDGTGNQAALTDWLNNHGGAVASDTCSDVTWTNNFSTLSADCSAAVTVIFTASDACGNTATTSATFTVQDTTAPVAPSAPANVNVSCAGDVPAMISLTAMDNCAGAITVQGVDVMIPGACANSFTIVRTWTFVDACGNTSSVSQNINVNDNIAPVAPTAPADITVACAGDVPAMISLTAVDNCSGNITVQGVDVTTAGACANSFTLVRTWTFVDACGNTSSVSQNINVNDNIAPVAPAAPADITVACAGDVPAMVSLTAVDNCSGEITVEGVDVTTPGACANSFTIVRTWTFVDACGNTSSVSQNINVNDNIAPVAPAAPADVTVACAGAVPAMVSLTATDNCSGEITVEGVDVTTPGACANSFTIVRTWTFVDACGNPSSVSQTINVNDNIAPVAPAAPADVTVACAGDVPAMVSMTAVDNCSGEITVEGVDVTTPGACANSFTVVRTWTFVDACGNTSSVSQNINVNDNIAPVAPAAPADLTVACAGDVPAMVSLTATDNCSGEITVEGVDVTTPGACANSFTVVRTWTFVDACGNTSSVSQTINVNDNVAPTLPANVPADVTLSCGGEVPPMVSLTATDNCSGEITVEGVDVTTPGACANSFTVVRTWTFVDACGNTSSVSQTINVNDNVPPVIAELPAASTISCPATPEFAQATATDNCTGQVSLTFEDVNTPGACAGSYSVTRTWTATDVCGNTATATQTINVEDTTAPVISTQASDITVQCDGTGNQSALTDWLNNHGGAVASDTCSDVTWTNNFSTIAADCSAAVTVIFTATDACGNASTTSATFSVQDTTAPVAPAAPADVTVACSGDVPAMTSLTATDNCAGAITVDGVDAIAQGSCANSYVITRTWTFTDACSNTSSVSQTITVEDTVAPVAPEAPADATVACAGDVPAMTSLTAVDNCQGEITVEGVDSIAQGNCANAFVVTRTWTFVDACGNTSSVSQNINVNDNIAPVAPAAPADITVACAGDVPAMVSLTAVDNCSGEITVEGVDVTTPGACANSFTIVRTWTFVDACGNTSSVSQNINVNDNIAPVAPAAPADVTVACAGAVPAMVSLTATDNCSGEITVEGVDVTTPGACANSFTIVRTWTFVDACGNPSSVSQTINVNDNIAPVAPAAPADVTVACAGDVPAMVSMTAVDNCSGEITVEGVDVTTPGACANSFTVVRTWTFVDACGNTSSVSQTINVNDNVPPVIAELPAASTISCPATPEFAQATATDNCTGQVSLTFEDVNTPGACAGSYSVTRTWTATDVCGNTATATQTINVEDTTAPVISTQASDITVQCDGTGNQSALTDWLNNHGGAVASDTCSDVTWTNNFSTIAADCSAAVTVIFTATDACGNASTTSATFSVQDTTAPVAPEAPADVTVACAGDVPAMTSLTAVDNCQGEITVEGVDVTTPDACANAFTVVRTWTFVDACGNTSSVSQNINVNDNIAPVAPAAPADVTVACAGDVPAMVSLTAVDNCSGEITVEGVDVTTAGACANSFTLVRTWTFVDACGNTSSVSQNINVNDNIAPVAPAAPADVTVACAGDVPAMVSMTAVDNCSGEITVEGVDVTTPGACANSFTIVRTWTFVDACGNTSSVSQNINVNDNIAPVAPAAPADVTVACAGDVPAMVSMTAVDNCSGEITVEGVDVTTPGACANSFTVVRTWTFVDACGNTSSVSQNINVNDNIAPVAPAAPADVTVACAGDVPAMVSLTAVDNCSGEITVEGVDVMTPGACANSFTVVRTWTFVDACGNTSSVSQTINVNDNIAPVAPAAPADVTVACAGDVPAMVSLTATDNCSGEITVEGVDATTAGACANSFTVVRTWTFVDACGNTSSVSQTINVNDNVAPTLPANVPADVTLSCGGEVPPMVSLTATDNCSGDITVEGVDTTVAGACAGSFIVTRTWTFADACGNTSVATQTINVSDNVAPTFNEATPADVTVSCDAVPAAATLTATDNCSGAVAVSMTETTTPGACPSSYVLTRTWSATDACGNTASVSQTINVQDTTAPTFDQVVPADTTVECSDVPAPAVLTASDNCGTATVTFTETRTDGDCPSTYALLRTWTATDLCGNVTTASQIVSVMDTTPPTVNETFDAVVNTTCDAIPDAPALTFSDACSTVGQPVYDEAITNQGPGTYTIVRSWMVSDACGNAATFTQEINVTITNSVIDVARSTCHDDDTPQDLSAYLPAGTPADGTWVDVNGSGALNGSIFVSNNLTIGTTYTFQYQIADPNCPRNVNINMLITEDCVVLPCDAVVIHNAFTPNGDGLNEYFSIEHLEDFACYPTNKVEIYNRWGVLVYETTQYDNALNAFKGISEGRVTVSKSSELPTGTYFYIIEWTATDGTKQKKDGYLYLSR